MTSHWVLLSTELLCCLTSILPCVLPKIEFDSYTYATITADSYYALLFFIQTGKLASIPLWCWCKWFMSNIHIYPHIQRRRVRCVLICSGSSSTQPSVSQYTALYKTNHEVPALICQLEGCVGLQPSGHSYRTLYILALNAVYPRAGPDTLSIGSLLPNLTSRGKSESGKVKLSLRQVYVNEQKQEESRTVQHDPPHDTTPNCYQSAHAFLKNPKSLAPFPSSFLQNSFPQNRKCIITLLDLIKGTLQGRNGMSKEADDPLPTIFKIWLHKLFLPIVLLFFFFRYDICLHIYQVLDFPKVKKALQFSPLCFTY